MSKITTSVKIVETKWFRSKILLMSISVKIFEKKKSISVRNFENLDFGRKL